MRESYFREPNTAGIKQLILTYEGLQEMVSWSYKFLSYEIRKMVGNRVT